jgi:hypothetical protein
MRINTDLDPEKDLNPKHFLGHHSLKLNMPPHKPATSPNEKNKSRVAKTKYYNGYF